MYSWQMNVMAGCCLGSVLAQMAFPLPASEICDRSEMGREKHISVPAESSHFFPFKKNFCRRGLNVTFFGKDVTKKRHKFKKKNSCARASHSSQKCDKCDASHFWKQTNLSTFCRGYLFVQGTSFSREPRCHWTAARMATGIGSPCRLEQLSFGREEVPS